MKIYKNAQSLIDQERRKSLKLLGGAGALVSSGWVGASHVLNEPAPFGNDSETTRVLPFTEPDLAISIMMSKSVRNHWIVIENLAASPLRVESFLPEIVNYRNFQLNLNHLAGTTTGLREGHIKPVLAIAPDYAWSTSLAGVSVWVPHRTTDSSTDGNAAISAISADTDVLKLWAVVLDGSAHVYAEEADHQPLIAA